MLIKIILLHTDSYEIIRQMPDWLTVCAFLYAVCTVAVTVGCAISWALAPEPDPEVLERALMRSSSWPTQEEDQTK